MEDEDVEEEMDLSSSPESKKKRKKEKQPKKPLNPLDPNDFVDYAKTQGVIRKFPEVNPTSLNSKQRQVYDFVTSGLTFGITRRLLVVGPAGSGKSYIVAAIRGFCMSQSISFRVMAFTGAASFNVGGSTIHSQLSIGMCFRRSKPEKNAEFPRARLQRVKLLILDEMSMVGLDFLAIIDLRLRAIFQCEEPFGNVSILMMGDYLQLPPIGDRPLFKKNDQAFGLEAIGIRAYEYFQDSILLDEIVRQGQDQASFREILSKVRLGRMNPQHEKILCERELSRLSEEEFEPFMDAPFLFADNVRREKYNEFRLMEMSRDGYETVEIQSWDYTSAKTPPIERGVLRVCLNSRIMLTRNLFVEGGLVNGAMATITEISTERTEEGFPTYIFILPDRYYGVRYAMRNDIPLVPIKRPYYDKETKTTVQRMQFPFVLAFAATVHKIQGQTLERVVIGIPPPDAPAGLWGRMSPNLFYVAIGRATTLEGVLFSQPFDRNLVTRNGSYLEQSLAEIERLRIMEETTLRRIQLF